MSPAGNQDKKLISERSGTASSRSVLKAKIEERKQLLGHKNKLDGMA